MLSESFVASLSGAAKASVSSTLKDVGICIHELQPASTVRATFKKSSTGSNGIAVSPTHVYAAQTDKAVVHVYSRIRGNQEATVPFSERIRSVAVAGGRNGETLVLGTEAGRLILWETCTGRQVSTTASHLQPVTSLVVDPTSNFIISGSSDATIHVWSLPQLLAFSKPPSTGRGQRAPNSPLLSFSNHRTPVTAIALGHSSSRCNFAVSTAADNTAVVWEYTTGLVLRTFLLPSTAISIAVDPADRAFYVGYDSGNVQQIDFYESSSIQHPLYDTRLQTTPSQIAAEHQWTAPSGETGAATSLGLSYDGMTLLSGHSSGSVLSWDVARGKYTSTVANFPTSVTNLHMLPPSGFSQHHSNDSKFTIHNVIKPRYDQSMSDASQSNAVVPPSYSFSVQLTLPSEGNSKAGIFTEAMMHPSFPKILIEEGLAELSALKNPIRPTASLDEANGSSAGLALKEEIATLKKQLSANENARRATTEELVQLRSNLSGLQDYTNELQQKQAKIDRERVTNQVNNEERDFQLRQAWFEAEKNGRNGDAILRKARSRSQDASGLDQMSE